MPIEWYLQDRRQGVLDEAGATAVRHMAQSLGIPIYEDTAGGRLFVAPPLRGRVIVIDPGHGGADPGHRGLSGRPESSITMAVAQRLAVMLAGVGARAVLTRADDRDVAVQARREIAYGAGADVIVSIHAGSYPDATVRGLGAFYGLVGLRSSKPLATAILRQLSDRTGLPVRTAKPVWLKGQAEGYAALVTGSIPGVIVECGCLSYSEEDQLLGQPDFLDKVADGIYEGLASYFSVEPISDVWPWTQSEEVMQVTLSTGATNPPERPHAKDEAGPAGTQTSDTSPLRATPSAQPVRSTSHAEKLVTVPSLIPPAAPATPGPTRAGGVSAAAVVQVGVNPNPLLPPGAKGPGVVFPRPLSNPGSPPLLARSHAPVTSGPRLVSPPVPIGKAQTSQGQGAVPATADPGKYAGPMPPGARARPFG